MIYFAQIDVPDGPVKIGTAKDINKRIEQFEKHLPWSMKIIAQYPGNRSVESLIHQRFFKFRIMGIRGREWFKPDPELLFWMNNIIVTPKRIFFDPEVKYIPWEEVRK